MQKARTFFVNVGLATLIIVVVVVAAGFALGTKLTSYQQRGNTVELQIQKREYKLASLTSGSVVRVNVGVGDRVRKGDVLIEIQNEVRDRQIAVLKTFGEQNVSAQTQLAALLNEKEHEKVLAPTTGIIADIVSEGEVVTNQQIVGTIYADAGAVMSANITLPDFAIVKNATTPIAVENTRLDRQFYVGLAGIQQELNVDEYNEDTITARFVLIDPSDTALLLQKEKLTLNLNQFPENDQKPLNRMAKIYQQLIGN